MASGESRDAPRYVVGIDLGTTNSAVAYVDTRRPTRRVETFLVLQNTGPSVAERLEVLPSFHFEPAPGEFRDGALRLPWQTDDPGWVVGVLARDHGAELPGRLVGSAKSWLCHAGVDRTAALLPWHAAPGVTKLSPITVSARILGHVRAAWNQQFGGEPLERQDVVVTVPASFDEIARELTVRAVREAGLPRVTLLEEPQAACYAWIAARGAAWSQDLVAGQTLLVCDVGGGTTDLTWIEVREREPEGLALHRVAVGEHLILGGDNLDLALAHHVERKLGDEAELAPGIWSVLVRRCQRVKEELLGPAAPATLTMHVPGGGSRLIGGGRQVELTQDEVRELLLDGFLPLVATSERPARTRTGFQEFGLPYAADPAITRHLAAFLAAARGAADGGELARPDLLLFNGGLFEAPAIRERVLEVLSHWFGAPGAPWSPRVLEHERLALAVAHGAAYYGLVRRGEGVRIAAGMARSYYVGVESDAGAAAMCLVPAGLEEGKSVELEREFELRIRQPVEFPLFVSASRTTDRPGELVTVDPERVRALPPIRTVLRAGKEAKRDTTRVRLTARLGEIGTLEIACQEVEGTRNWNLQFDVRSATRTDVEAHAGAGEREGLLDEETLAGVRRRVHAVFAGEASPQSLVRDLEQDAGSTRDTWPPGLLRRLWEDLLALEDGRQRGVMHEARWLNLLGFALRPGYGFALDDWRVAETWKLLPRGLAQDNNESPRAEWWILWRRIGGGLSAGQQLALAEPLLSALRGRARDGKIRAAAGRVSFRGGSHETAEIWRLLGSLEWLPAELKIDLGRRILGAVSQEGAGAWNGAAVWALGRLGARVPQYGPLNAVVPLETVEDWVTHLLELPAESDTLAFTVTLLARRTGDRYRDVSSERKDAVLAWLERHGADAHYRKLVASGGELADDEQRRAFGESLPAGIRLL